MNEDNFWVERFEEHRPHLRAVAYRMLGSYSEADDALQETWVRFSRADADEIQNLGGWLTTVTSRVCLNLLRTRATRREERLDTYVADPVIGAPEGIDPEHEALMADSVGVALLVVLETLPPAERLAFVLHDMFAVPFDDIAPIVGRSATAARQLASRARRRVQGAAPTPGGDLARQREIVDAFFAAARRGDFEALVAVLDPSVVLRSDRGPQAGASRVVHGAAAVAAQALMFAGPERLARPALINGRVGVVITTDGLPISVMGFTTAEGKIIAIDALVDPDRLHHLDLTVLGD